MDDTTRTSKSRRGHGQLWKYEHDISKFLQSINCKVEGISDLGALKS